MNNLNFFKRNFCILLILMLFSLVSKAQTVRVGHMPDEGAFTTVNSLGGGYSAVYDSYLSANRYTGYNIVYSNEGVYNIEGARIFEYFEDEYLFTLSRLKDDADYSLSYALSLDATIRFDYKFFESDRLTLHTGPGLAARIGVTYNPHNSNNPAQANFYCMLAPHIAGIWRFSIADTPLALGVKSTIPLLGVAFAPEYGQLYYEIYEYDGYKNSFHFAWPLVMPTIHNRISLDFPLGDTLLRLSYNQNYSFQHYSDNISAASNHSLMIGVITTLKEFRYGK